MPDTYQPEAQSDRARDPLDDVLASFTDQVLASGKDPGAPRSDLPELRALEDMVLRLQRNLPATPISPAVNRKMQAKLAAHWAAEGPRPTTISLKERLRNLLQPKPGWQSSAARQRTWILRTAAAAVVFILAAVFIFSPTLGGGLSGTAGLEGGTAPLLAILLVAGVLIAAVWWIRRQKP